jgi:hypothetical protein
MNPCLTREIAMVFFFSHDHANLVFAGQRTGGGEDQQADDCENRPSRFAAMSATEP